MFKFYKESEKQENFSDWFFTFYNYTTSGISIDNITKNMTCFSQTFFLHSLYRVARYRVTPKNGTVKFSGLCFDQQLFFSPYCIEHLFLIIIPPRSSNLVCELFILWVISYGLSFSGFARFPEFRGTINDSFSSKYMRQHMCWRQHSTSYKEISVPMTCLDCKSLLGYYTDQWTQYSLNLWTAEAVINHASELWKSGKFRKWQSIRNYS